MDYYNDYASNYTSYQTQITRFIMIIHNKLILSHTFLTMFETYSLTILSSGAFLPNILL